MKTKNTLSVVIPFFNEEENITKLVFTLNNFFKNNPGITAEVIFVNDGSNDNSVSFLKKVRHKYYHPKLVCLSKNYGSHAAVRAGILHAKGSVITILSSDLQDPIELITDFVQKINKGNNIVWAARKTTSSGLIEIFFSRLYSIMIRRLAVSNYPIGGFDVVAFDKKVKKELDKNIEANSSVLLQIINLGFKQSFITYNKKTRMAGRSKWTLAKKIKLFIDSFVAFSYFPIRMVTGVGILFFIVGVIWTVYILWRKIFYRDLASGWPSLVSILMIGFGITNISLGIISEYLWRILDVSRKRPVFIIDKIIDLKKS